MKRSVKIIIVASLMIAVFQIAYCVYLPYRYLSTFDAEVNDIKQNIPRRELLKSLLTDAKGTNKKIYYINGKSINCVHNGIISTDDGKIYYIVYLEHHSNDAEINKVAIINNDIIVSEFKGHICGGLNILERNKKDIQEVIKVISR